MLDLVFVVLGSALISLMGWYAMALRQLWRDARHEWTDHWADRGCRTRPLSALRLDPAWKIL